MFSRKDLKIAAKEQIKGNVGVFFGLSVIWGIIFFLSSFTVIGPLFLYGAMTLGYALFIIEVVRTKNGKLETGFNGFKQYGSSFVATLLIGIFTFLWSILFVIPGIIASFRYSMTYFILADNPKMSGLAAIKKSKEMMKGHKWDLFILLFSFFWWYLLGVVTLGLAYIYVYPYVIATVANFYEKIKDEQKSLEEDKCIE